VRNDKFEWNDDKARSNKAKHGVSFEAACAAFDDPNFVEYEDADPTEFRFVRIGRVGVLLVAVV